MEALTQTELSWLREIVQNTTVRFSARELRRFALYLAKAIVKSRAK